MHEELRSKVKPNPDIPEEKNIEFAFNELAGNIAERMADPNIPESCTIAIDGDWGSGKTTLLNLIRKKLEQPKFESYKIINFSSWKYERTGAFEGLLYMIINEVGSNKWKWWRMASNLAVDMALRKMTNLSLDDVKSNFKKINKKICTFEEDLKKIIQNNKFIIFIDDLDRCSTENALSMLEDIKNFMNIKNIMIVMALDVSKINKGLKERYGSDEKIAAEYTEKMFLFKIAIPTKDKASLKRYIRQMTSSFGDKNIDFLTYILPPNPRKIKLALNMIYFTLNSKGDDSMISEVTKDHYLCTLATWIAIKTNHKEIANLAKHGHSYLVYASYLCSRCENLTELQNHTHNHQMKIAYPDDMNDTILNLELVKQTTMEIAKICAESDHAAFETLKHYGMMFNMPKDFYLDKSTKNKLDGFRYCLNSIIENMPS